MNISGIDKDDLSIFRELLETEPRHNCFAHDTGEDMHGNKNKSVASSQPTCFNAPTIDETAESNSWKKFLSQQ